MAILYAALNGAGPPLLFGLRLWASVCLALYIAFWLQLDNPFWAGTSAAIVCQPQLGASLRKGWFRMIGTLLGATMIVVLTACFPQDRIVFLGLLALWCSLCAFAATALHNFASYAAALAGYTAAIIAADNLGATGGASPDVFMLAITRASEICIGIVCAGIVLAGTDLGGAQRRLAESFASLATIILGRFIGTLTLAGQDLPDTGGVQQELVRRVVALDPMIDQALGESSHVRYHSPILQTAVQGLFRALAGWHGVSKHLNRFSEGREDQAETLLRILPPELRSAQELSSPQRWIADPMVPHRGCKGAVRTLLALPAGTPSMRLLADEAATVLAGLLHALEGVALLVDAPNRTSSRHRGFRLSTPDWLPALVNAGRAFVAICAVELFWVVTAWPSGGQGITFATIVILLLSPRGELAFAGALAFTLGTAGSILCAAIVKFAALPGLETFTAFCFVLGIYLVPIGIAMAQARQPALLAILTAMAVNFMPLLAPTNQMSYDTGQFYNIALAVVVGCGTAAISFQLIPPLSPSLRAHRLLWFTLRDLRRLGISPQPLTLRDWEQRMYGRLAVLPDKVAPSQRAQLLAALCVGNEVLQLRRTALPLGLNPEFDAALAALSEGRSSVAINQLALLERRLASSPDAAAHSHFAIGARARVLALSETIAQHASYFDAGQAE
jgi:uncharacterized membrane protein YccC